MDENKDFNLDSLKVFEDDQKEVLLSLLRHSEDRAEAKVKETMDDMGVTEDELDLGAVPSHIKADQQRLTKMREIFDSNGYVDGSRERLSAYDLLSKDMQVKEKLMKDSVFSSDHPLLIPRVLSEMAREAVEPNIVLTGLLQRINYSHGTQIVFPAWGAMHAADIPEGGEYPERSLELAGEVTATIGKKGVALKISEEALRYGPVDLLSRHVSAAGKAMIRWKEQKVATMMLDNAVTIMDNHNILKKSTTANGTMTLDDLFWAWGKMIDTGFTPNAIIMHPLAWMVFANEGISRAFGFENGRADLMWQAAQGSPGNAPEWRMGGLNQQTKVTTPGNVASTFTNVPSISPVGLQVIVSPYMTFDSGASEGDIILCDTRELGVLIVDEELMTETWTDPSVDMQKTKFRERYAVAAINGGNGMGLIKAVNLRDRAYDHLDKTTVNLEGLHGLASGFHISDQVVSGQNWSTSGAWSGTDNADGAT